MTRATLRLREYFETYCDRGVKSTFAEKVGMTGPRLSEVIAGRSRPTLDQAIKIATYTAGAVPIEDWARRL